MRKRLNWKPCEATVERVYRSSPNAYFCYDLSFSNGPSPVTAHLLTIFDQEEAEAKAREAAELYNRYQLKYESGITNHFISHELQEYSCGSHRLTIDGLELAPD